MNSFLRRPTSCPASLALALWLFAAFALALTAHGQPLRVAIMDFTSEDNSYPGSIAAVDFSSVVRASLSGEAGLVLVEREELNKARHEMELGLLNRAGSDAVRSGRLLQAEFLVLGRFTPEDKAGWTLLLEWIDLNHAEVTARRTVTLGVGSDQPLRAGLSKTAEAVAAIKELMAAGRTSRARRTRQTCIAPLFIANVLSGSGFPPQGAEGLQQFEETFIEMLGKQAASNPGLRLVQYPRANRAIDESEMILAGLIAADSNAWQRVADYFVWGTITNMPPGWGANGRDGRVDLVLTLWDGRTEPRVLRERLPWPRGGTVSAEDLSRLAARCVQFTLAGRASRPAGPVSETLRQRVAASIVDGVQPLRRTGPGGTEGIGFGLSDPQRRREYTQVVQMLETACFFDPGNREAQELLVRHRWGDSQWAPRGNFWTTWRRSEAWGRYVEQFGLESHARKLQSQFETTDSLSDQYQGSLKKLIEMTRSGVYGSGYPKDVPPDIEEQWKQAMSDENVRRLRRVAQFAASGTLNTDTIIARFHTTIWLQGVIRELLVERKQWPVQDRLEWVERILPRYHSLTNANDTQAVQSLHETLHQAYARAGRPRPPSLRPVSLKTVPQPVVVVAPRVPGTPPGFVTAATTNPAEVSVLNMPNLDVPPPLLNPAIEHLTFPKQETVYGIRAMAFHRGRLWILGGEGHARNSIVANPELSADVRPDMVRLWSFDPATKEWQRVNALASRTLADLWPEGDRLWVAGDGLHALDLRTGSTERVGVAQGISEIRFQALAISGGRLHVATHPPGVCARNLVGENWEKISASQSFLMGTDFNADASLAGDDRWLLYIARQVLMYDGDKGTWTNFVEASRLVADQHGQHRVPLAAEPGKFWIGTESGLHRLDPKSMAVRSYLYVPTDPFIGSARVEMSGRTNDSRLVNQAVVKFYDRLRDARVSKEAWEEKFGSKARTFGFPYRLPGPVSALAQDGEFLWISTSWPGRGAVLLFHKPTESWVGMFDVKNTVESLAVSEKHLWMGVRSEILCVEKLPLQQIPRQEWVPDAVPPEDLDRLLTSLPARSQAIHAFFKGDYQRVESILGNVEVNRVPIESLFLLAFSNDTLGLNHSERVRQCLGEIVRREGDSPWATIARTALRANDEKARLLAQFDRNHDGRLDAAETRALNKDSASQRELNAATAPGLEAQFEKIIARYDRNRDGRLARDELLVLQTSALRFAAYEKNGSANPALEARVAPFRWFQLTNVLGWLETEDLDKDGRISVEEMGAAWRRLGKQ